MIVCVPFDINAKLIYKRMPFQTSLNPSYHIDGLMQERRNSSANELELRLSYTNP